VWSKKFWRLLIGRGSDGHPHQRSEMDNERHAEKNPDDLRRSATYYDPFRLDAVRESLGSVGQPEVGPHQMRFQSLLHTLVAEHNCSNKGGKVLPEKAVGVEEAMPSHEGECVQQVPHVLRLSHFLERGRPKE
jgi:hypothetical protein